MTVRRNPPARNPREGVLQYRKINSIRIPHITVVDYLLLVSESELQMQDMLCNVDACTNQDRYLIHPGKITSLIYPAKKNNSENIQAFKLSGKDLKVEQNTLHLGIKRGISNWVNIAEKVNPARRAAYALTGVGFHGGNRRIPSMCAFM